jgi:hypothetical protein
MLERFIAALMATERTNHRNGYRHWPFDTWAGTLGEPHRPIVRARPGHDHALPQQRPRAGQGDRPSRLGAWRGCRAGRAQPVSATDRPATASTNNASALGHHPGSPRPRRKTAALRLRLTLADTRTSRSSELRLADGNLDRHLRTRGILCEKNVSETFQARAGRQSSFASATDSPVADSGNRYPLTNLSVVGLFSPLRVVNSRSTQPRVGAGHRRWSTDTVKWVQIGYAEIGADEREWGQRGG